jgi:rRNA-processing protein FCF1
MKLFFLSLSICFSLMAGAQQMTDTTVTGSAVIIKDARITTLEDKLEEFNTANAKAAASKAAAKNTDDTKTTTTTTTASAEPTSGRTKTITSVVMGQGYRVMVISTNDRELALRVRSQLYQNFPGQKPHMAFQMPNTKVKLGDYVDRADAEKARKRIIAMKLVTNNVYVIPDVVEIKVTKRVPIPGEPKSADKKDE